jgi:hypothetical protein
MILILEVTIFLAFVLAVISDDSTITSISDSYHNLKEYEMGYLFGLMCLIVGSLHALHGGVFFVVSGVSLASISMVQFLKLNKAKEGIAHYWLAVLSGAASLLGLAFSDKEIIWPSVAILIIALSVRREHNALFLIELFSFLLICMGVAQL